MRAMTGGEFFTGYLPDPKNPDRPFPTFASFKLTLLTRDADTSEGEYQINDSGVPIFDQGQIGSCVLNAWCELLEILLCLEGKDPTPLSRLFAYWLCREQQGTLLQDSGTYPYLAGDRFTQVGCVPESMWPYTTDLLFKKPAKSLDLYSVADDNRITGAYRLMDPVTQLDDIEACIRRDHPVVWAVPVSNAIFSATATTVLDTPAQKDVIGGHCMLLKGVRRLQDGTRQFLSRNSWGPGYAFNGYVWVTENYVLQSPDNWTGTRMEDILM